MSEEKENFIDNSTYFQVYQKEKGVSDLSEYRLICLIKKYKKKEIEQILKVILKEYKNQNIALAWKSGEPVYIPLKINKEDTNSNLKEKEE